MRVGAQLWVRVLEINARARAVLLSGNHRRVLAANNHLPVDLIAVGHGVTLRPAQAPGADRAGIQF